MNSRDGLASALKSLPASQRILGCGRCHFYRRRFWIQPWTAIIIPERDIDSFSEIPMPLTCLGILCLAGLITDFSYRDLRGQSWEAAWAALEKAGNIVEGLRVFIVKSM